MSDWRDRIRSIVKRDKGPEVYSVYLNVSGTRIMVKSEGVKFRVLYDRTIQIVLPLRRNIHVSFSKFAEGIQIGVEKLGSAKLTIDGAPPSEDYGTMKGRAMIYINAKTNVSFQLEGSQY